MKQHYPTWLKSEPRLQQIYRMQLDLFKSVQQAYAKGAVSNDKLYDHLVSEGVLTSTDFEERTPVGRSGKKYQCTKRRVRWIQQTLRQAGLLESAGRRGHWQLTPAGRSGLSPAAPNRVLVAFCTKLGVALWADCHQAFAGLDEPLHLIFTSPPYPLAKARAYGNVSEIQYVDWLCGALEPVVKKLVRGGSLVLNISQDIFVHKSPERSLYPERLLLALNDRLGLKLLDRNVWTNPCRPPGPIQWASKSRVHLNAAWEPVYWLSNDPHLVRANNQRVLEPHSEAHLKLIARGGETSARVSGDGAHRVRVGAYGRETAGRIPRNLQSVRHNCADQDRYKAYCRAHGLPTHGASMPLKLAKMYVEFLTEPGDLVADPFGGSMTTAKACEELGRQWITAEMMGQYLQGAASRFHGFEGFEEYMTPVPSEGER